MKKRILFVSVISAIILVLVSFTPSITANVSKPDVDVVEEDVTPTPIVLALQLMTKLRNHKEIQNVETEEDVLRIIEGDEELNNIFEKLSDYEDCGCDEESSALDWGFPIICILLAPLFIFSLWLYMMGDFTFPLQIVWNISEIFNCPWT